MITRADTTSPMPLQKSFSEQNGSTKVCHQHRDTCMPKADVESPANVSTVYQARQHWSKSKSHSFAGATRAPSNRPLEPVSAATKNKLNAFSFHAPADQLDDSDTREMADPTMLCHAEQDGKRASDNKTPNSRTASTPISRLAWQDLIGMPEIKETDEDASPQERLTWDARQGPQVSYSPIVSRRRHRKRARSSSPTSSPASSTKPTTAAVNIKQLSRALKSPHADPAMELWDRFALSGPQSTTPTGANNFALSEFMVSSSPQPRQAGRLNNAAVGESSLRRAISCGTNWPKRRRLDRQESSRSADGAYEASPSGSSKTSMVNALLRNMTGELNRSQTSTEARDNAESPTAKRSARLGIMDVDQSPSKKSRTRESSQRTACDDEQRSIPPPLDTSKETQDFGFDEDDFDDFDDDTLLELDNSISMKPQQEILEPQNVAPGCHQSSQMTMPGVEADLSDDEFADMDDIFAAAETLVSQLDGSYTDSNVVAEKSEAVEDEYGDDLGDDFDFDAAELAATQSVQQAGRSVSHVRR